MCTAGTCGRGPRTGPDIFTNIYRWFKTSIHCNYRGRYWDDRQIHRLIKITDRTLDVVFSRFRGVSFTITLRRTPKGVTRMLRRIVIIFKVWLLILTPFSESWQSIEPRDEVVHPGTLNRIDDEETLCSSNQGLGTCSFRQLSDWCMYREELGYPGHTGELGHPGHTRRLG